jgi:hypothetical protein
VTESPHAERDDWAIEGSAITSPAILEALQALLDHHAVIVERGYYRGSRAPERCFFNDYEEFSGWLKTLSPGDVVYVWDFDENCRDDNTVAAGKVPDADGRVPRGGAY